MTKKSKEDISGSYVVVEVVRNENIRQISLLLESYDDAESFRETMANGYSYHNKVLKIVKIL